MARKIFFLIFIILILGAFSWGLFVFNQKGLFGWRLDFEIKKFETGEYLVSDPEVGFKYSKIFDIDSDEKEKYGKNYVIGLKLKNDMRTGCDIRKDGPGMDYSKNLDELANEVINPIKEKSRDFNLLDKRKVKIDGKDGLRISFSFLDPINTRVRLDHIFLKSGEDNFIVICGTGEYQYAFFEKDFNVFYDSIRFGKK